MDNFLAELEQITQSYNAIPSESTEISTQQQTQHISHTRIENQENPDNWVTSVAEIQDYQALNQEIEADRTTSKIYIAVGSGLGTLGSSACLGNWALEQTYNPTGYMVFSGVLAASLVAAGLSGSRINGRSFYSSPWLLSSIGAAGGLLGGSYAVSRPYFQDAQTAQTAKTSMQTEIRDIEVKPKNNSFDFTPFLIPLVGAVAIALLFTKK